MDYVGVNLAAAATAGRLSPAALARICGRLPSLLPDGDVDVVRLLRWFLASCGRAHVVPVRLLRAIAEEAASPAAPGATRGACDTPPTAVVAHGAFDTLPTAVVAYSVGFLPQRDVGTAACASRALWRASRTRAAWRHLVLSNVARFGELRPCLPSQAFLSPDVVDSGPPRACGPRASRLVSALWGHVRRLTLRGPTPTLLPPQHCVRALAWTDGVAHDTIEQVVARPDRLEKARLGRIHLLTARAARWWNRATHLQSLHVDEVVCASGAARHLVRWPRLRLLSVGRVADSGALQHVVQRAASRDTTVEVLRFADGRDDQPPAFPPLAAGHLRCARGCHRALAFVRSFRHLRALTVGELSRAPWGTSTSPLWAFVRAAVGRVTGDVELAGWRAHQLLPAPVGPSPTAPVALATLRLVMSPDAAAIPVDDAHVHALGRLATVAASCFMTLVVLRHEEPLALAGLRAALPRHHVTAQHSRPLDAWPEPVRHVAFVMSWK